MLNQVGLEHLQAIETGLDEAQPSDNDLNDAIGGIISLQQFYNLQPSDIANGLLMGQQYKWVISLPESYQVDCEILFTVPA